MKAVDLVEVIQCFELGRNPGVHRDELPVDDAGQRQVVEHHAKGIEDFLVVLEQHFLAEREGNGHLAALVVSAEQHEVAAVVDLHADQQENDFHRVHAAVHVVPQE